MKKTELVGKLADEAKITKSQAERILNIFLREISRELREGYSVRATGFGTFSRITEKIQVRRHLAKKSKVKAADKEIVRFKPEKALISFLESKRVTPPTKR